MDTQTIDQLLDEIEQDQGPEPRTPSGFQYTPGSIAPPSEARESNGAGLTPLPHQPKRRLLIALVLLALLGFGGFQLWSSFFRYSAHGIVDAHCINISAPLAGNVLYMHVREGAQVKQGQLIVTLHDLEARHRFERIGDELRLAQANLSAEMARLQWQMQVLDVEKKETAADYSEAAGRLEEEVATQKKLERRLARARTLHKQKAVSRDEFEAILYDHQGQTEKVAKLREALKSWKQRAAAAGVTGKLSMEQIDPLLVRVNSLRGELRRARQSLKLGEIRSPVNGRLSRWHVRAGEYANRSDKLFSIIEEGSSHVTLYLPQRSANRFTSGDAVGLEVAPFPKPILFSVVRVGPDLTIPPEQIKRHYSPDERLFPVHLVPTNARLDQLNIPNGAHVRLTSEWFKGQ